MIHIKKTLQTYSARITFLYVIGLTLAITALLGTILTSSGMNITKTKTVLLNPKYAPLVSHITLSRERTNENLSIERTNNGYRGIIGELIFPIDAIKVSELITKARNSLILYTISDSYGAWESLSIDDSTAIVLTFWGSDNLPSENTIHSPLTEFSRLYFGSEDFSLSQITIRTARSPNVYRTQNDFYPFLSFSPSAWSAPKLIPDYLKNAQSEADVVSLSLIQNSFEIKLFAGDNLFDDALTAIFSLQSSRIIDIPPFLTDENTPAVAQVRVTFQKNHTAEFFAYAQGDTYIIVPTSSELRYAIEISEWTFERILNAFQPD